MKTVCLVGMDGCGKSTQCKVLENKMTALGVEAKAIHMLTTGKTVASRTHGLPIIKRIHRRLRDLPDSTLGRPLRLIFGLSYYFFDAWVTYCINRLKYRKKVVIYDRYFYDQLVIFVSAFDRMPYWVIDFARILPRCNVNIIFEVPPQEARKRKPEHTTELLERYSKLYRLLSKVLKVDIIDGTQSREAVSRYVFNKCSEII